MPGRPVGGVAHLLADEHAVGLRRSRRRRSGRGRRDRRWSRCRSPGRRSGRDGSVAVEGADEAGVAEAVVAVDRGAEVGVGGALVGRRTVPNWTPISGPSRQGAAGSWWPPATTGRTCWSAGFISSLPSTSRATQPVGPLPRLGDIGVEDLARGVRPVGGIELVVAARVARRAGRCVPHGHGRAQLDRDARDARLPVLGGRVLRVELVAGGVVADRADDAAVLRVDPVGRRSRRRSGRPSRGCRRGR